VKGAQRLWLGGLGFAAVLTLLAGCSAGETEVEPEVPAVDENSSAEEAPVTLTFSAPADCTVLLPNEQVAVLTERGFQLTGGPGSPSNDPIYVEGQTPEELVGGLSCLYSIPGEEEATSTIVLSAAAVDESIRPTVINDLIAQQLNVGQTPDGALTYWKWGDDVIVPAVHNSLYDDSWFSAIIQPGGREAYDLGVSLVQAARAHNTQ
jgi:hypothetical protein